MDAELKPCPFCSGTPHRRISAGDAAIVCSACGASTDGFVPTSDGAELAWNRRVPSPDLAALQARPAEAEKSSDRLAARVKELEAERDQVARERTGVMKDLHAVAADRDRLRAELEEIIELTGGGGDGTARGAVESLLADRKELMDRLALLPTPPAPSQAAKSVQVCMCPRCFAKRTGLPERDDLGELVQADDKPSQAAADEEGGT